MNPKIFLFALVFCISCSKSSDSNEITPKAIATIAGKEFNASAVSATDTGMGLEIKMASGNQTITLITSSNTSGTYNIISTTPSGRTQAGGTFYGTYSNGNDVYNVKTGTVTINIAGGKASAQFSVSATNAAGNSVSIEGGNIPSLTVNTVQVPAGKCLISGTNNGNVYSYVYDNEGKLLKVIVDNSDRDLFMWVNGVVTSHIFYGAPSMVQAEDWFYTNGKLSKVAVATMIDSMQTIYTTRTSREYVLNAEGKPEQIVFKDADDKVVDTKNYTYDSNGNCTNDNYAASQVTYSNYDNYTNRYKYIASALGLTFDALSYDGFKFSNNNVRKAEYPIFSETDFVRYIYDAQGKVTQVIDSVIYMDEGSVYSNSISYKCN